MWDINKNLLGFISHMVQMKEKIGASLAASIKKLYIPHGSDERFLLQHYFFYSHSLYPTWFR